jgi:hypothetical protein
MPGHPTSAKPPAIVPLAIPEEGLNGTLTVLAPAHLAEDNRAGTK